MAVAAHIPCAPRITVGIADDCPVMREGLSRLVADECDLAFAGSAASGEELRRLIAARPPKVLVMDLVLRDDDGLGLIGDLAALAPELRVVIFTSQPGDIYAARCLRAGAHAYVAKHEAVATLFRAVRETAAGGIVVPTGVSPGLFAPPKSATGKQTGSDIASQLTNRELQIFRLAGQALPTRVIAEKLGVSIKTVESHREHIKNKLALENHAELVARAAQWLRESGGA